MSRGVGARRGARPGGRAAREVRQGGRALRGELLLRRRAPACLAGEAKQLAGAAGGLGRPGGPPGKSVGFLLLVFLFLFLLQLCGVI